MDVRRILVILLGLLIVNCVESVPQKVCQGTSTGLSHREATEHYEIYKLRYENCTIVNGNLELVWLGERNYDLGFLRHIQEVTGYVIIMGVASRRVPLSSLRIIRGKDLFKHQGKYYSLYVALNYRKGTSQGLQELQLTSLHEILYGDIFFYDNPFLCHVNNDVNWDDILGGEGAQKYVEKTPQAGYQCEPCHMSCNGTMDKGVFRRHCWGGHRRKMCQRLTKLVCSPQCDGRCYGTTPRDCCHPECAGGCTGPSRKECWACKNFYNVDQCVPFCPPQQIYDQKQFKMVPNPKAKYTFDTLCVIQCPKYLVHDQGACVKECGAGKISRPNAKRQVHCEQCDGPCPKACNGTAPGKWVNSNNINSFVNCTYIKGNLRILSSSFVKDHFHNVSAMEPSALQVFENVKEISGFLVIQSNHKDLKDLSFFKNLETVQGRSQAGNLYGSFSISATPLMSLGLSSLKSVKNGRVVIVDNKFLCYAYTINWDLITAAPGQQVRIRQNMDPKKCNATGKICHPQCTRDGCWGPGDHECLRCKNYQLGKRCLRSCYEESRLYDAGNKQCKPCDKECLRGCSGPGSDKCSGCKNAKDGPYCVRTCPITKYADDKGICQSCHKNCEGHGCSGPLNIRGKDGCNACSKALVTDDNKVTKCLSLNSTCEDGYFKSQWSGMEVCRKCHEQCLTCIGAGLQFCEKCKYIRQGGQCVQNCYADYFVDRADKQCQPCSDMCRGCNGPSSLQCHQCRLLKVYLDRPEENGHRLFNCTEECPPGLGHRVLEGTQEVCADEGHPEIAAKLQSNNKRKIAMIVGVVIGVTIILGVALALFGYYWQRRARAQENALKLTARMSGLEESEPLTPTDARPDMACMRLVKESELRRGNIIGSGAFGTVYKGVWIPDGENVKIPVAIKVLQEGTSPSQNKELLEEARVMASVEHPCCVRILAVCMTAQMMLITQLMPLGCLLDYVRKNKNNIGSKALLNWCTQIARGMGYLEERGIVHRDLAARNVLVQSPAQVKITDFGLAKLLDINEEEYHASGGKMPIKWLALECIQHRIFTHKSDVWSYGVTIWELFTYGQRPYETVRAREIPDILEKGERLSQPGMCTIDVYMIMIKCWMLDAESRPSFSELAEEFAKMARDPGRYLAIEGDKYMRLPSQSYEPHDLLRGMSVAADTPGQIIDAEDYLQPQPSPHLPPESPPPYSPGGPMSDKKPLMVREPSQPYDSQAQRPGATGNASREGSRDKDYFPGYRRDKKYGNLEAAAAMTRHNRESGTEKRSRGDSVNSRYCPDPCKVPTEDMKEKDDDLPDAPAPPTPLDGPGGGKPRGRRMELPVDEDDYLQPKSSNPAAYMDLIADKDEPEEGQDDKPGALPPYLDVGPGHAIDNPEYFQTVDNGPVKHEQQPLRLRTMSTESEGGSSEHDYYNEYDRLKREKRKKPQKVQNNIRTESTV